MQCGTYVWIIVWPNRSKHLYVSTVYLAFCLEFHFTSDLWVIILDVLLYVCSSLCYWAFYFQITNGILKRYILTWYGLCGISTRGCACCSLLDIFDLFLTTIFALCFIPPHLFNTLYVCFYLLCETTFFLLSTLLLCFGERFHHMGINFTWVCVYQAGWWDRLWVRAKHRVKCINHVSLAPTVILFLFRWLHEVKIAFHWMWGVQLSRFFFIFHLTQWELG